MLTEAKGEINRNTMILGEFNTPFSTNKKKINEEAVFEHSRVVNLIITHRTFCLIAAEYRFWFSFSILKDLFYLFEKAER